jgi:hypothetical protein
MSRNVDDTSDATGDAREPERPPAGAPRAEETEAEPQSGSEKLHGDKLERALDDSHGRAKRRE